MDGNWWPQCHHAHRYRGRTDHYCLIHVLDHHRAGFTSGCCNRNGTPSRDTHRFGHDDCGQHECAEDDLPTGNYRGKFGSILLLTPRADFLASKPHLGSAARNTDDLYSGSSHRLSLPEDRYPRRLPIPRHDPQQPEIQKRDAPRMRIGPDARASLATEWKPRGSIPARLSGCAARPRSMAVSVKASSVPKMRRYLVKIVVAKTASSHSNCPSSIKILMVVNKQEPVPWACGKAATVTRSRVRLERTPTIATNAAAKARNGIHATVQAQITLRVRPFLAPEQILT